MYPDIYDQPVLTQLIRREWTEMAQNVGGGEKRDFDAARILPLKRMDGRHVKIKVREILPIGMAQFRAPHGEPALWTPRPNLKEKVIEIVDIDEMHRIDPVQMLHLKSPDPALVKEVQLSLVERGAMLQVRNEMRSDWMRWEALKGTLTVNYPDAASIVIDYGIPVGNFPTFGTPWTDLDGADPIEHLWTLGSVALASAGIYLPLFHMNNATFRYMRRNTKLREMLSSYGRSVMMPTDTDIKALLRDDSQIQLVDSGYLPENASDHTLTKWIPDGKIMATPSNYRYANTPIGDMADGWVLVSVPNSEEPVARQGMQSEILGNKMRKQTFLRQASARVPRLYAPEAIAWGTAYTP